MSRSYEDPEYRLRYYEAKLIAQESRKLNMQKDSPTRRAVRTLLQLIAAGGFTALIAALTDGLSPQVAVIVVTAWATVVSYVQNLLEDNEIIPNTKGTE